MRNQIANATDHFREFYRKIDRHPKLNEDDIDDIASLVSSQSEIEAVQTTIEKRRIISDWRNWEKPEVEQLAGTALDAIYRECKSEKHLANSVRVKLDHLINLAQIPPNFREMYTTSISYKQPPYENKGHFVIQVPDDNFALGYGIFDLLNSLDIVPESLGDSNDYDGTIVFQLSHTHLLKLNLHIEELNKWYDNFLCIVGDLLGSDDLTTGDSSVQFVSIGKKQPPKFFATLYV